MLQPKKPVVKKTTKKDDGNGANDYKNMVDKSTGKKGTMGGEGTNRGPNYKMLKGGGKMKKAKSGGKFPDLNKDGKITKADILVGKGVIKPKAKTGMKVAKCKTGCK
jgi:hypothetical protein